MITNCLQRNVQVTLQILEALIEKAPRDLPLYARNVLKILGVILKSNDITMVEASIPTFEAFCLHHDGASLQADLEYLKQYEEIVSKYASFASTRAQEPHLAASAPVAMKWRVAGLKAVKSVASSPALSSVAGRQLDVIMPILLENLWTDDQEYLGAIVNRARLEEKVGTEKLMRRRGSIATVRTHDTSTEQSNPLAISASTAEADQLAEQDIGVLAIQCLKQIFSENNRTQIRGGTVAVVNFISERVRTGELVYSPPKPAAEDKGWATTIFLKIARWTPVQERFTVLVTAMESLVRSSLSEESIPQEHILTVILRALLRSDINLIGLSVMDVLLGLIQHVLRLLQLSGAKPHQQQTINTVDGSPVKQMSPSASNEKVGHELAPSEDRKNLLHMLEQCIGDLATHVYYADQVSDMITAILLHLKPPTSSPLNSPTAAIDNPEDASNAISASGNLTESSISDGFFSFETAKVIALNSIKNILLVATKGSRMAGATLGRNRVGINAWEATQWLLRDPNYSVRRAYCDALLTWLEREVTAEDSIVVDEKLPALGNHRTFLRGAGDESTDSMKAAASSPTHREKSVKSHRTTFLELLHLAIYESALQFAESETDIAILHLLLVRLEDKLGINAVKCSLPMIFRLQEDIQDAEAVAKVGLGSLCHGYFWALSEKFDFDTSPIGREIHGEISRRVNKGFWVDKVKVPPVRLNDLETVGSTTAQRLPEEQLETESLTPFDHRSKMVDLIITSYSATESSLSISPAGSPGRMGSFMGSFGAHSGHGILDHAAAPRVVPERVRDMMLSEWSKESVIQATAFEPKSASLNSRSGSRRTAARNYLSVNGNGNDSSSPSHAHGGHAHHGNRSKPPSIAYGLVGAQHGSGTGGFSKLRQASSPIDRTPSESSKASVVKVDHLKRVLSGAAPPSRGTGVLGSSSSTDSNSMVSYDATQSEVSYDNRNPNSQDPRSRSRSRGGVERQRAQIPGQGSGNERVQGDETYTNTRPLSSHPPGQSYPNRAKTVMSSGSQNESIPPVPPLPSSLQINFPRDFSSNVQSGGQYGSNSEDAWADSLPPPVLETVASDEQNGGEVQDPWADPGPPLQTESGDWEGPELTLNQYLSQGQVQGVNGREASRGGPRSVKGSLRNGQGRTGRGGIDIGGLLTARVADAKFKKKKTVNVEEPPY